jgi:predicted nucleotidyltransferase
LKNKLKLKDTMFLLKLIQVRSLNSGKKRGILELRRIAEKYKSERFVIDGIDEEARKNNQLVVEAIETAGRKLDSRFNEVFGINMGGSRIKGFNTKESDIDLVVVRPDTATDTGFVYDTIEEELSSRGITNKIDVLMGMWAQYDIETDPENFIYRVDHHGNELITLFGYSPYHNANLDLTRLAALEIIQQYTQVDYDWEGVARNFADTYLGERNHVVEKFAARYGISTKETARIFPQSLLDERHRKLGLENPKKLYSELKQWHSKNKRQLRKYQMYKVYNRVLERLKLGF